MAKMVVFDPKEVKIDILGKKRVLDPKSKI
jgi:hypothetical protein